MREEIAVISTSTEALEEFYKNRTPADYVRHIQNVNTGELWFYLTEYMRFLKNSAQETTTDISRIEEAIHVVQKGFRYYSEKNNALRYFLYGYFSNQQDELLQKLYVIYNHERIERVLNKKHLRDILMYLYEKKVVKQTDLVKYIKVSKTNISHIVMPLIECDLVEKIKAGFAFYKLTANGYEYCRQKLKQTRQPFIGNSIKDEFNSEDESLKTSSFEKEDTKNRNTTSLERKTKASDNKIWVIAFVEDDRKVSSTKSAFLQLNV